MKPKKIWANLGVKDIARTQEFYLKLGFKLNGNPSKELVSFLFGEGDFIIHFFEKKKLETSLEGRCADLKKGSEVMFSFSAENKAEYDSWVKEIQLAGGTILFDSNTNRKEYYEKNGFFVCVFADPDGHKFNLLYSKNK